jgi:Ca2+-binding EF-hand superfamily protein
MWTEPIDFAVAADITSARTFSSVLHDDLERNKDLIVGDESAHADVAHIQSLSVGSVGRSTELQARALNAEMVNEQETEQEKQKQKEQEEQSQIRFSREDEQQRPWKIYELAKFMQQPQSPLLARSARAAISSLSLTAPASGSGTVRDSHPFYPFNSFSVRGVNERDIDLPPHLLLSSNYFRAEWAAMGQRRLKNIIVVLEWAPNSQFNATTAVTASASTAVASSAVPSSFSSSALLTDAQESALRVAWRMFASDSASHLSVSQLQLMMREVGEELNEDDLQTLRGSQSVVPAQISYDDFRSFLTARSAKRTEGSGRFFVAVSLREAESLRRLIHTQHPLFAAGGEGSNQVSIGLRLLNGSLLDASPHYQAAASGQQALALQSLRFINSEFFYNDIQLALLLKSLQLNRPVRRLAFFENLLQCRRRDRRRHNDTPLNSIFQLADEQALLAYRAKVARVRFCLKGLNLSLQDAFSKFDSLGDTFLNTTELAFALIEYLQLPLTMEDVQQLMLFANKKGDGLLSLDEFIELLREPEIVSQTFAGDDVSTNAIQSPRDIDRREIDGADAPTDEDMPSVTSSLLLKRTISTTRLTLTPAYERLYAEEETARRKKSEDAEKEAAMARAEKIARDLEQQQLAEQQARDWRFIQEQRKAAAIEERWTCPACTYKNEPTAHFCIVCEGRRPEVQEERKENITNMEDIGDGQDGPAFWCCAVCSYNNDATNEACEMSNTYIHTCLYTSFQLGQC